MLNVGPSLMGPVLPKIQMSSNLPLAVKNRERLASIDDIIDVINSQHDVWPTRCPNEELSAQINSSAFTEDSNPGNDSCSSSLSAQENIGFVDFNRSIKIDNNACIQKRDENSNKIVQQRDLRSETESILNAASILAYGLACNQDQVTDQASSESAHAEGSVDADNKAFIFLISEGNIRVIATPANSIEGYLRSVDRSEPLVAPKVIGAANTKPLGSVKEVAGTSDGEVALTSSDSDSMPDEASAAASSRKKCGRKRVYDHDKPDAVRGVKRRERNNVACQNYRQTQKDKQLDVQAQESSLVQRNLTLKQQIKSLSTNILEMKTKLGMLQ